MHTKITAVREIKGEKVEQEMVFGTGNLVSDPPEIFTTDSGKKVLSSKKGVNFSIAFNQGPNKDAVFYPLVAWEKNAVNLHNLAFKGQSIEIVGRINTRTYEKDGETRSIDELIVEKFHVKSFKDNKNTSNNESKQSEPVSTNGESFEGEGEPIDIGDDDLPF